MVAQKKSYKSTTYDRNLESFEFGLDFTDVNITEEIYRNGLAGYWIFGLVNEALGDGFDLLDRDGNPLPIMEDIESHFEDTNFYAEFMQAVSFTRAYGKAGILAFADGSIKAFAGPDMQLSYDLLKREFTEANLMEYADYSDIGYVEHKSGQSFDLNDFLFMIFKTKGKTLQGKSELESIWDYLQGLFICAMLSPLIVAQVTGVKVMKSPQAAAMTDAQKTAAARPLRDMSWKLRIVMPATDSLEILYPPSNNFIEQTADLLFTYLAGATGLPKEAWRGNQVGTTSGASQTEKKLNEIHKTIQKTAKPYVKKVLRILSEINNWALPDSFTVDWRFKETMSQEEEAALKVQQAQAIPNLAKVMSGNEIREFLNLTKLDIFADDVPLDQDSSKIATQESILNDTDMNPEANTNMNNNLNNNLNGDMNNVANNPNNPNRFNKQPAS